jgi:hypothetical protein
MPAIDLSILNQRQTPAFYADTLANRPSAGFIGRIFVSTNTFEFYRDNGTTWDLIGGPGTSTVTGTGANGQVTYWNGTSSITGSNNLFFDAVNGHLGIGTITPGTALEIDHDQNTIIQLQQTVATNDNRITFINSGVGLWRLGAFYNAGANDFGLFDIAAAAQPVTVKRTTGQVLIGTSTVGSGKLVVASATGDNGVQIVGASAPSLRIDNAESSPTKRLGIGLATAVNNFIQGSIDRDMCVFNGSTGTAGSILFGIYNTVLNNVQEAARINQSQNFLIGTNIDNGYKLYVSGNVGVLNGITASNATFNNTSGTIVNIVSDNATTDNLLLVRGNSGNNVGLVVKGSGNVGIGTTTPVRLFTIFGGANTSRLILQNTATGQAINNGLDITMDGTNAQFYNYQAGNMQFATSNTERMQITAGGNLLIGTTTDAGQKLQVNGTIKSTGLEVSGTSSVVVPITSVGTNVYSSISLINSTSGISYDIGLGGSASIAPNSVFIYGGNVASIKFQVKPTGVINMPTMPTSSAGLVSGDLWNNSGVVNIIP